MSFLQSIPMAPVSRHVASWVHDFDLRNFQTYQDCGLGMNVTADGKFIVTRKRPNSSSW